MMAIKGMALSHLYPNLMLQPFSDIDIYLDANYEMGNELLLAKGGVSA